MAVHLIMDRVKSRLLILKNKKEPLIGPFQKSLTNSNIRLIAFVSMKKRTFLTLVLEKEKALQTYGTVCFEATSREMISSNNRSSLGNTQNSKK